MIGTMGVLQNGGGGGKSSPCGRGGPKTFFPGGIDILTPSRDGREGGGGGAQQVSDR